MSFWKNNIYDLSSDGLVPSLLKQMIDNLRPDTEPSIIYNSEENVFMTISNNIKKDILTELHWTTVIEETFENGFPSYINTTSDGINQFYVGGYEPFEGLNSIYNSNNGDSSNTYDNSVALHFYYDVAIPTGITDILLNAVIKCASEAGFDGFKVFACDTTVAINGGTALSDNGSTIHELTFNLQSSVQNFQEMSFNIPSQYIGNSVRLVFQFTSDSSMSNYTGLNVDNLKLKVK